METVFIRTAEADDYAAYVRLFAELGIDQPPFTRDVFLGMAMPLTRVAVRHGEVVGYCFARPIGARMNVNNVAVAAQARRLGVGRALLEDARQNALRKGLTAMELFVKADNVAAIALYRAQGFSITYESAALRLTWGQVQALPISSAETVSEIAPGEDSALEAAFALPRDSLATSRATPGAKLLKVCDGRAMARGFAVFTPSFPGIPRLMADCPSQAFALVRACHAHRQTEFPADAAAWQKEGLQVMAPVAGGVVAAFAAQGGHEALRLYRMTANLCDAAGTGAPA